MHSIQSTDYIVHFQENAIKEFNTHINKNSYSKIFILVDSNTRKYCLPYFLGGIQIKQAIEIIEIKAGEVYKNLDTCITIWNELTQREADRKTLLVNLGGGVITDMGGFVASTFKRGIRFINIPTTLLSMVDASVGGKTGIDLGVLKNQIGMFSNPEMVLIDSYYLKTVPVRELKSGLAEIIKYGFTFDKSLWEEIQKFDEIDIDQTSKLIHRSIEIKNDVVLQDPKEQGIRKTLNFGHTIGHAIESYFLENKNKDALTHGEAIAVGMVIELYYSHKLYNFPMEEVNKLKEFVNNFYQKYDIREEDFQAIIDLMIYDKKNVSGKVYFVLLSGMESCEIDVQVADKLLVEGLKFYIQ
ncbi:MAG: 3-dehydroquinate synthase [Bacteroidota bacterium]